MTAPSRKDRKGVKPRRQRADRPAQDTGTQVEVKQSVKFVCGGCAFDIVPTNVGWCDPHSMSYDPPRQPWVCTSADGRHRPVGVEIPVKKKRVLGALTREEYNERHR